MSREVFPGQDPDEKIVMFIRKHWMIFLGKIVILLLMFLLPVILVFVLYRFIPQLFQESMVNIWVVLGASYLLILGMVFLLSFIDFYFDIVILTDKRIIDINQRNLFNRVIDELDLLHVEDTSSKIKGFLPTFFNFGDAEIQTAGANRNFILKNIPNPRKFCLEITKRCESLISKDGRFDAIRKAEGLPAVSKDRFKSTKTDDKKESERSDHKDIKPPSHFPQRESNQIPKKEPDHSKAENKKHSNSKIQGDLKEGETIDFSKFNNEK